MLIKKYSLSLVAVLYLSANIVASTSLSINKGWNLVGSNKYNIENIQNTLQDIDLVWVFEDGKWKVNSPNNTYAKNIKEEEIPTINSIKSGMGFWIKSDKSLTISLDKEQKESPTKIFSVREGWNLLSLKNDIDVNVSKELNNVYIMWKFQDGQWVYYTTNKIVKNFLTKNTSFKSFEILKPTDGFWYRSLSNKDVILKSGKLPIDHEPVVNIDKANVIIEENKDLKLDVKLYDEDNDSITLNVQSLDPNIAIADYKNGSLEISAKKEGVTVITLTPNDGKIDGVTKYIYVTVKKDFNHAPILTLSKDSILLKEGDSIDINASVKDDDGDNVTVTVTSANFEIAEATYKDGKVTIKGIKAGSTSIKLTPNDGEIDGLSKYIKVKVEKVNQAPTLTLSMNKIEVDEGKSAEVTVTATDPDGDDVTVGVKSSDESVATVSYANGKITITGVAEGSATITVEATDGKESVSKNINVSVTKPEGGEIPSDATAEITISATSGDHGVNYVTATQVQESANGIKVNFAPLNANPSNSSATIVLKKGEDVIAVISPDDMYNGKDFYITYNGKVYKVTYNKDATDGEIVLDLD